METPSPSSCLPQEYSLPVQRRWQGPRRRPSHQQSAAAFGAQRLVLNLGAHLAVHVAARDACRSGVLCKQCRLLGRFSCILERIRGVLLERLLSCVGATLYLGSAIAIWLLLMNVSAGASLNLPSSHPAPPPRPTLPPPLVLPCCLPCV